MKPRRPRRSPSARPTLAPGTLVAITVTARNPKGESQPTDAVTAAVP